jgi:NAD(P)-dependent dehydrogenase (short-subunit alcohol dehydrogenase family)
VYLAARNEERAKAAIESLHNAGLGKGGEHNLGEVVWLKLDLGDPREAKKAAEEFLKLETRLDVLCESTEPISNAIGH